MGDKKRDEVRQRACTARPSVEVRDKAAMVGCIVLGWLPAPTACFICLFIYTHAV